MNNDDRHHHHHDDDDSNNNNAAAINNNHLANVDGYRCDFENFQKYDVYTIDDDDEYKVDSF